MMKKIKRGFAALAITLIAVSAPMSVFASQGPREPETILSQSMLTPENGVQTRSFSAVVALVGNSTRCYGRITANLTAETLQAKCEVNNDGTSVTTSGYTVQNNTTVASSGYVYASTEICTYTATGKARQTSTSSWHSGSAITAYN